MFFPKNSGFEPEYYIPQSDAMTTAPRPRNVWGRSYDFVKKYLAKNIGNNDPKSYNSL
jgi:hypothetical protein